MVAAELYFPATSSLKEKRMYLRSIRARLTKTYGATFAEVGAQDLWQRADVIFAIAASDIRTLDQLLNAAEGFLSSQEFEVIRSVREVHEVDA